MSESKIERSRIMARVKGKNTAPELKVRKAVHAAGFRFRLHRNDLPGKPDLVFSRFRIAVFVNGCFWHWHGCKRSRMPKSNSEYWAAKIERNVIRDRCNMDLLRQAGWDVHVIWECELREGIGTLIRMLTARRHARTH